MAAAVPLYTVIAGKSRVTDYIHYTETVSKRPCLRFVNPHQWRMKYKTAIHGEIQCHIQRFDKIVPTIRISAEICLGNTCNNVSYPNFTGIDSSNTQEKEIYFCLERTYSGMYRPVFPNPFQ